MKSANKQATKKEKLTIAADRKPNRCVCGCGTKVHNLFAQGHNQRVRGMLQRHADDASKNPLPAALQTAVKAGLVKHLERVRPNARLLTAKAA